MSPLPSSQVEDLRGELEDVRDSYRIQLEALMVAGEAHRASGVAAASAAAAKAAVGVAVAPHK